MWQFIYIIVFFFNLIRKCLRIREHLGTWRNRDHGRYRSSCVSFFESNFIFSYWCNILDTGCVCFYFFICDYSGSSLLWVGFLCLQQAVPCSSCSTQAWYSWHTGLVAPWLVESSGTRDQTGVPSIMRRILNHWTPRAAQDVYVWYSSYLQMLISPSTYSTHSKKVRVDFPEGPAVKTSCFHCSRGSFDPLSGN